MTVNARLKALAEAGVSIWLDDLSRSRIESGNLAGLIAESSVTGVTTNPSIFQAAIGKGGAEYAAQLAEVVRGGGDAHDVVFQLTTTDVRDACDLFADTFAGDSRDGRVSIEVEPTLAHDTAGTVASAKSLWAAVDRPNALIKIPATKAGLPAIAEVIAAGISVNVTLIFSVERHREVMDAYATGLERALAAGIDLSTIHSVASFFVSRVDTEIDARLDALGSDEARACKGKAGVVNALDAYAAHQEFSATPRWAALAAAGANPQRPLWASTGVKNPAYPDTLYVSGLALEGTVNTMPEATLNAFADHGEVPERVSAEAGLWDALDRLGVDLPEVFDKLETEGVDKFIASWSDLIATVEAQVEALKAGA